jgi:hypothetical protein
MGGLRLPRRSNAKMMAPALANALGGVALVAALLGLIWVAGEMIRGIVGKRLDESEKRTVKRFDDVESKLTCFCERSRSGSRKLHDVSLLVIGV